MNSDVPIEAGLAAIGLFVGGIGVGLVRHFLRESRRRAGGRRSGDS